MNAEQKVNIDSSVMGEVCFLMAQSELHKDWPMSSVFQWVLPALASQQFRLYRRGEVPMGFVSWAYLSAEIESRYVKDPSSLDPSEWNSGDRLWFLDWVAPNGGTKAMTKDLRENIFPDDVGRFLRWKENSETMNIFYVHGTNAVELARDYEKNPAVVFS